MTTKPFFDKVVLVTGAARGIGAEIARRFAELGATAVIADRDSSLGSRQCEALRDEGLRAQFIEVDLSISTESRALLERVRTLAGPVDVLVNNARAGSRQSVLEQSDEDWDFALNVGLRAPFILSQTLLENIRKQKEKACIINIASVAAQLVTNESPAYHAVKSALLHLTRYFAVHGGPSGLRTNAILPGLIIQDEHKDRYNEESNAPYRELVSHYQPNGIPGTSADIAEAACLLASPQMTYLNGTCLTMDGGATTQEQFGLLLRATASKK